MVTQEPTATTRHGAAAIPRQTTRREVMLAGLREVVQGEVQLPPYEGRHRALGDPQHLGGPGGPAAAPDAPDRDVLAEVRTTREEDVAAAVRWAAANGVAVSAGGPSRAGTVRLRNDALDAVDVGHGTVWIGAGATWGEVLAELQGTGWAVTAGEPARRAVDDVIAPVGAVRPGWFSRMWGLPAHDVVALDVIDADGRPRRVTAADDPELWWALRGGGGAVAVVTAVEMRLHRLEQVYGGRLVWPSVLAAPVLRMFASVARLAPRSFSAWALVGPVSGLNNPPEGLPGKGFVAVALADLDGWAEAEALMAGFREVGEPVEDTLGVRRLTELDRVADVHGPADLRAASTLLHELDEDGVRRLACLASSPGTGVVQLRGLGGALAQPDPGHGVAGHIEEPLQLVLPDGVVPPVLAGLPDRTAGCRPEALARLLEVRRRRDPRGTLPGHHPLLP